MKDLTIEKLDERNTGNYHLIRKVNELCDTVNEIVRGMQEIEKSMYPPAEVEHQPDSSD